MTTEAVQAFVERLNDDETFRNRLGQAPGPEERLRIAEAEGYAITASDADAIRTSLGVTELSDDELNKVAGGLSDTEIAVMTATTGATTVVLAASAALI
jgi:predicted ribosomally synthesized peptide with nif11-like leader